MREVQPVTMK